MTDLDFERADKIAHAWREPGRAHWSKCASDLARCYQASRAREAELEALFQQHHGVHVSWVAVDAKHRERIARLEALVRSLGKCRLCAGSGRPSREGGCPDCAGTGLVEAARKEIDNG